MPSYTPVLPSGATDGQLISIGDTSTTLHDTTTSTSNMDEVFVYVCNTSTAAVKVTLEIDNTTVGFIVEDSIPPEAGFVLMLPRIRCNNTTNIDAKAATDVVCNALVLVNRITLTDATS